MKKFAILIFYFMLCSCASSNVYTSSRHNLSDYKYVVFGGDISGDGELSSIIMFVENEISATNLNVVSKREAIDLIYSGIKVLSPSVNVKSEKWDGGSTYITINFHDFDTNELVAIVQSSGIGLSINHDQNIARNAISQKLRDIFGER